MTDHNFPHGGTTPPGDGDGRRGRSARSRAQIVNAAHTAFVQRGYVGTTIEGIAELAGVSVQTVYAAFGNKRALLGEVLDATIVGDHADVPLIERDWVAELDQIVDARQAASHLGIAVTRVLARTSPIFAVLSQAAADPGLAPMLEENRRRRRRDVDGLVATLARNGLLRHDVTVRVGADALFAIASEDVYLLLTGDCGWSQDQIQTWITEAIERLVLA